MPGRQTFRVSSSRSQTPLQRTLSDREWGADGSSRAASPAASPARGRTYSGGSVPYRNPSSPGPSSYDPSSPPAPAPAPSPGPLHRTLSNSSMGSRRSVLTTSSAVLPPKEAQSPTPAGYADVYGSGIVTETGAGMGTWTGAWTETGTDSGMRVASGSSDSANASLGSLAPFPYPYETDTLVEEPPSPGPGEGPYTQSVQSTQGQGLQGGPERRLVRTQSYLSSTASSNNKTSNSKTGKKYNQY
jgi:hypothetical protein